MGELPVSNAQYEKSRGPVKIDLLLRRSQIGLSELEKALGAFFETRRASRGRREWLEGTVKNYKGLTRIGEGAVVHVDVPLADAKNKDRITRFLSRFSSNLYRLKLINVDLVTLLGVVKNLQGLGVDIGFVEDASLTTDRSFLVKRGEIFRWPANKEAQLSTAAELYRLYASSMGPKPLVDLDFLILSLRSVTRRKLRTAALVLVMSLVCANFIQHLKFTISSRGVGVIVAERWELPLAAGLMALIIFLNLMEISLYERMVELGTIRALGAETTTTLLIFAAEGMIIGSIGAMVGYLVVIVANLAVKFGGINPGLDLSSACGPGKAILALFLGIIVGFVGAVLPVIPLVWRAPEKALKGPK